MPQDGAERLRGHGASLGAMDTTVLVSKSANLRTPTVVKSNDAEEGETITFTLESVTIGPDTNAPVVIPADTVMSARSAKPKLTKNQQTMFSLLQCAGASGLTTERWYEMARNEGIGVKCKADCTTSARLSNQGAWFGSTVTDGTSVDVHFVSHTI
jgi:hypothetical protein